MRILIATPLFPPDIAGHATYVKELASRFKGTHEITILAYNHIPEHIEGVKILVTEKQLPLPVRVLKYTFMLLQASRRADVVYVQNGASTELPMVLVSPLCSTPFILRLGDDVPLCYAEQSLWHRLLLQSALRAAQVAVFHLDTSVCSKKIFDTPFLTEKKVDVPRPLPSPEILPFEPYPLAAFEEYEISWLQHLHKLNTLFS
jgi:glycosyltransferase involved in cell wall biosynthesis